VAAQRVVIRFVQLKRPKVLQHRVELDSSLVSLRVAHESGRTRIMMIGPTLRSVVPVFGFLAQLSVHISIELVEQNAALNEEQKTLCQVVARMVAFSAIRFATVSARSISGPWPTPSSTTSRTSPPWPRRRSNTWRS
jgi:hypothetical protein